VKSISMDTFYVTIKEKTTKRQKKFTSETIAAGAYLLLCKDTDFEFKIGGDDTVTLFDAGNAEISSSGAMTEKGSEVLSYQRKPDGTYVYATPTPNAENVFPDSTAAPSGGDSAAPTQSPSLSGGGGDGSAAPSQSPVLVINEVGDKGTYGTCGGNTTETGEDYIELLNTGSSEIDLNGYILCDDKGKDDDKAKTFASETIAAGAYLLLCKDTDFEFGIGGDDTVTLFDAGKVQISSSGIMTEEGSEALSYQRKPDGTYVYAIPTPGAENFPSDSTPTQSPVADCRKQNSMTKLFKGVFAMP